MTSVLYAAAKAAFLAGGFAAFNPEDEHHVGLIDAMEAQEAPEYMDSWQIWYGGTLVPGADFWATLSPTGNWVEIWIITETDVLRELHSMS